MRIKINATMAMRFLVRRRQASPIGLIERCSTSSAGRPKVSSVTSAIADPRVDQRVGNIDDDGRQHESRGADNDDSHNHVVVARAHGFEGETANARYA